MNAIAIIDIATLGTVAVTALALLWRCPSHPSERRIRPLVLGLVVFSALYYAALAAEWIWTSAFWDALENFLGAIYPMWWALVFYAILREISNFDLERSKEQYRFVVENQRELVAKLDPGKQIDYVSPSFRTIFGKSDQELMACPFCSVIFPGDECAARDFIENTFSPPYSTAFESSVDTPDGRRWFDWSINRLEDQPGGNGGFLAVGRDVTDKKRAEALLIRSEQQHRQFIENQPVGMFRSDPAENGRFMMANPAMAKMLGYDSPDDLLLVELKRVYVDEQDRRRLLENLFEKKMVVDYEVNWRKRDGTSFVGSLTMNLVGASNKTPVMIEATMKDITRQKDAEEALVRSERLHRQAQKIAGIGHWELDVAKGRISFSDELFRIAEIDKDTFDGRTKTVRENIHPDDFRRLDEAYASSLAHGTAFDVVYQLLPKEGRIKYIHSLAHVQYDASRRPARLIGTAQDVTRLKEAEMETAAAVKKLGQAQKLEAIGTLAGGIAHDFNNILTPIIGFAEMAMGRVSSDEHAVRMLKEVVQAGMRARDLVSHILAFSRETEQELRPIDVGLILKEAVKLLRATIPTSIEITQTVDTDGCHVLADPVQIHQIVMNLSTNAYHAIGSRNGRIHFKLQRINIGEEGLSDYYRLSPGRYMHMQVQDTGSGIPKDVVDRIFDPYFTTKNRTEGTGLGLAVVHGIVQQYRGYITVYSEPGLGAVFHIYLPCAEADGNMVEHREESVLRSGDEHILVVDDEAQIGQLFHDMLTSKGYRVSTFTESEAALAFFEADPDDIDLVFTDMTMPVMGGDTFARRVLAARPDIPVFICSGYGEMLDSGHIRDIGIRGAIRKPVLLADIAKCIQTALAD